MIEKWFHPKYICIVKDLYGAVLTAQFTAVIQFCISLREYDIILPHRSTRDANTRRTNKMCAILHADQKRL